MRWKFLSGDLGDTPELRAQIEEEKLNHSRGADDLRRSPEGRTNAEATCRVFGTKQQVIARLEDADYEGHSLSMLQRIAAALGRRLDLSMTPIRRTQTGVRENMAKKRKTTRCSGDHRSTVLSRAAEREAALAEMEANVAVADKIRNLRAKAGFSQRELAKLVGTTASVICRLEDADYEGHSLAMLNRIAAALDKRVEIRFLPPGKAERICCGSYTRSKITAMPWPTPMHMVARPSVASRSCMAWMSVVAMRAPEAPSGWPMAIAPPRTLTFDSSMLEHSDAGEGLGGERFVEFDEVDVGELQAGALECLLRGGDGAGAHHGRVDAGDGRGADFHQRREAERLGPLFAHHQQRGGAVVERRAVAGGHGAHAGHERGLQRGERFQAACRGGCIGRARRGCGCRLRRGPRWG